MKNTRVQHALAGFLMVYLAAGQAIAVGQAWGHGFFVALAHVLAAVIFLGFAWDCLWLAFIGERRPLRLW